jgi:hypothetical protein
LPLHDPVSPEIPNLSFARQFCDSQKLTANR